MTISRTDALPTPQISALVHEYPFHSYREHKIVSVDDVQAIALNKIRRQLLNASTVFQSSTKTGNAIAIIEEQPWDSSHFGFPNYRITLIQSREITTDTLSPLLAHACREIRLRNNIFNIAIEIDEMDYTQVNSAIMQCFQLRDSKRIYIARNSGTKPMVRLRNLYHCRPYVEQDRDSVFHLLKGISFPSRFTRDRCFPADKVGEMYAIWTEKLLQPPHHDRPALVVENSHHEIVAFGTGQDINLGESHHIKTLCGDGLFFSNPRFPGTYMTFLQHLRTESIRNYKAFEIIVSASNLSAIHALEKTGFISTPGRYSFHLNHLS